MIFASKGECGHVHDFEIAVHCLLVGKALIAFGGLFLFRVGAVDPVDIGGLEHGISANLGGPQDSRGVGCEKRVPCARRKQEDSAALEMVQSSPALISLA